MSKVENDPLNWNELVEKREKVFKECIENNITIRPILVIGEFLFGKFKKQLISDIIRNHPDYIEYVISNFDDRCFKFGENFNFESKFIRQQYFQFNAIKLEIAELQLLNDNKISEIPEIPSFYKYIVINKL